MKIVIDELYSRFTSKCVGVRKSALKNSDNVAVARLTAYDWECTCDVRF